MSLSSISSNDSTYLATLFNAQQAVTQMPQNCPFAQILQNTQSVSQAQTQQSTCHISGVASQDFQNLATALQAGDLSGAQQAYTQLTQDMQGSGKSHGHHHHHHSYGSSQTNTANQVTGAAGAVGSTSPTNGQTSLVA